VIVAVKVATTDCIGLKLEIPEDQPNNDGGSAEFEEANGSFRVEEFGKLCGSFHRIANCCSL
jgi:hypothetical protein